MTSYVNDPLTWRFYTEVGESVHIYVERLKEKLNLSVLTLLDIVDCGVLMYQICLFDVLSIIIQFEDLARGF